jgi:hypothetical protein
MKRLTFHTDPGHGWLEVSRAELRDLGLLDKVSSCSYQAAQRVYLEEDCDASLYIEALKSQGLVQGKDYSIHVDYRDHTPIRFMDHFHIKQCDTSTPPTTE